MTNEELAARVKAGDKEAAALLWEQNRGLCSLLGWRLYSTYRERAEAAGVTMEDVQQISFPAILTAAKSYDPQEGTKFSTYFPYHFRREFRALIGMQTERSRKEPLCRAGSLDAPIDAEDTDGSTRAETVPDPDAAAQLESAEERIYMAQLHDALEEALQVINTRQADVLRMWYFDGQTLNKIAESFGVSANRARQLKESGLRAIQNPRSLEKLETYRDQIISRAYQNTSFEAWKTGGSSQERWAEWIESKEALFS